MVALVDVYEGLANACIGLELMQTSELSSHTVKYTVSSVRSNRKIPLCHIHDLPQRPWEKVSADLYTIPDKDYLILVDYFSNFWEINQL